MRSPTEVWKDIAETKDPKRLSELMGEVFEEIGRAHV